MSFASAFPISRLRRLAERLGHPSRFVRYVVLKLAYKVKSLHVPVTPIRIDIEPINSCNFRCNHCQVTHWDKAKAQLDIDAFKRIIDSLPHVDEVKLQGMGEPLLNKQFIDLLKEGERRGLTMRFHSNASACTEPIARRLLELKNTHITFSVDGGTAATFERVRPGSNFARIVRNIRSIMGCAFRFGVRRDPIVLTHAQRRGSRVRPLRVFSISDTPSGRPAASIAQSGEGCVFSSVFRSPTFNPTSCKIENTAQELCGA